MNNIQIIKIARSIVALDAKRLRSLQEKYDDEYEVFDEVISEFEQLSDLIEGDSSLEENRGFWDKLFNQFDPDKISESIITHVAGGLFVKAFKLLDKLTKAENNRQEIVEKFEDDAALERMTKKELSALLKEIRNQKKLLNNFEKNKESLIKSINAMSERTESLKKNDKLKDIAKNQTIKDFMGEINQLLNEAAELINSDRNIGEISDDIAKLDAGYAKIKKNIEQGKYVKEQQKSSEPSKPSEASSFEEKLEELNGTDTLSSELADVITLLQNLNTSAGSDIDSLIKKELKKLKWIKSDGTELDDAAKDSFINPILFDKPESYKQKVESDTSNLIDLLNNNSLKDFYIKLNEIAKDKDNPIKYYCSGDGKIFEQIVGKNPEQNVKSIVTKILNKYKINDKFDEIKTKFEEIVNNYNPVSLRITRTSSLNKIAKRIAESYK